MTTDTVRAALEECLRELGVGIAVGHRFVTAARLCDDLAPLLVKRLGLDVGGDGPRLTEAQLESIRERVVLDGRAVNPAEQDRRNLLAEVIYYRNALRALLIDPTKDDAVKDAVVGVLEGRRG